ncbi:hypothetical protein CWI77_08915 [Pseudidiomarina planktonica]|nr:hypothetical protein CWI77_08915 [Pseudidiomarina planktonica]
MPMPKKNLKALFISCCCLLITACAPAPEKIWQRSADGNRSYVADIANDASFSVTSSDGQELIMWHRDEARPRYRMQQEQSEINQLIAVDISADGQVIAAASKENFALWDTNTGELQGYWRIQQEPNNEPGQRTQITSIVVSKKGDVLAMGLNTGKVIIFNPRSGRRLEMLAHTDYITSLAISPNGKYLLSGSYDGTALLWNTDTAAFLQRVEEAQPIMQVALDANGRWFFTADRSDEASIWSVMTGEQQAKLQFNDRKRIFSSARFSHDGNFLLTGTPSRMIEIWDTESGDRIRRIEVSVPPGQRPTSATVLAVAIDPNQQTLWSENSSGIAELWQLRDVMPNPANSQTTPETP